MTAVLRMAEESENIIFEYTDSKRSRTVCLSRSTAVNRVTRAVFDHFARSPGNFGAGRAGGSGRRGRLAKMLLQLPELTGFILFRFRPSYWTSATEAKIVQMEQAWISGPGGLTPGSRIVEPTK